jgi:heptosyltransferase II
MSGAPPETETRSRERILVVCTQYIGDTLLAIPFLRNLRRAHPDAVIDVCAEGGPRAVLANCPYVDDRVTWSRPPRERRGGLAAVFTALQAQAAWLRARQYTRAYLLKPSFSAAALAKLAGIPCRIGFAGESSPLLTRRVRRRRGRHQVETYLDLLRAEGFAIDDARNENWVRASSATRIGPLVDRLPAGRKRVFLAVQSTDVLKHWPADRWQRLVRWLVDSNACEVVLCGGSADIAAHDALREAVGPAVAAHVHDVSEWVSLADATALAVKMDLCIGIDTGLVHLASSVGVPAVVLVGPTDPNRWSPWRTRSIVLRSSRVTSTFMERVLTAIGATDHLRWPLGTAATADIPVADVEAAVGCLLGAGAASDPQVFDLTDGSFRYEVFATPPAAASPPAMPAAAEVPAT